MSKRFLFFGVFSLFLNVSHAQLYFFNTVDDTTKIDEKIFLQQVVATADGGVLACGSNGNSNEPGSAILISLDSSGALKWSKRYDADINVWFKSILPFNNGFYVGGEMVDSIHKGLLVYVDSVGNLLNTRIIDGINKPLSISKIIPAKKKFLLNSGADDLFILQMDSDGNLTLFNSTHINAGDEQVTLINDIAADEENFYFVGERVKYGDSEARGIVGKGNSNGKILWMRDLRLKGFAFIGYNSVASAFINDNQVLRIYMNSYTGGGLVDDHVSICRFDSNGVNISFDQHHQYGMRSLAAVRKNDNSLLAAHMFAYEDTAIWFVNYDEHDSIVWSYRYYHPAIIKYNISLANTSSNSIFAVGHTDSAFIMKLQSDGTGCNQSEYLPAHDALNLIVDDFTKYEDDDTSFTTSTLPLTVSSPFKISDACGVMSNIQQVDPVNDVSIFPNPFFHDFHITCPSIRNAHLFIYNLEGKQILSTTINSQFEGGDEMMPGIYFVKLLMEDQTFITRKIVKLER